MEIKLKSIAYALSGETEVTTTTEKLVKCIVKILQQRVQNKKYSEKEVQKAIREVMGTICHTWNIKCEEVKKAGRWTKLFLRKGWIPKVSRYMYWYHLFFPTEYTRNKLNQPTFTIDDTSVYRFIVTVNSQDGSAFETLRFRLTMNSHMVVTKITYRVIPGGNSGADVEDHEEL